MSTARSYAPDLVDRYSKPVPRYTSYPTAPHFHAGITADTYRRWLAEIDPVTALSLYVHVPFCDRLCWFCGCHTKQVLRYDPIAAYLPVVEKEMATVGDLVDGRGQVTALHFGGGSPSMVKPEDLLRLVATLRDRFAVAPNLDFSLEIDPNDMTGAHADGWAAAGVSRVSLGVQDFNPKVQEAINRIQTFKQTRAVVEAMRARGVNSVNLDVLYGLPFQTVETVEATVDMALSLNPDRLALFGYAHVPWMKTHQKMIDESALPDIMGRLEQSVAAQKKILAAGFVQVGIDHFARPADGLGAAALEGTLHRNFQGYTTDRAPALIGLGASAIGGLPQGHIQNVTATGEYMRQVLATGLAVARGLELTAEDRLRGHVIERLMCDFALSVSELSRRFGSAAAPLVAELQAVALSDQDGFIAFDGEIFGILPEGRPFTRTIAARFDAYLAGGAARHSVAV